MTQISDFGRLSASSASSAVIFFVAGCLALREGGGIGLTHALSPLNFNGCLGLHDQLLGLMALPATQIRRGMVLVFDGDPCRVLEFRHHTPGNLRAMVQAKLKNLRTGSSFEHRFRAADTIEKASMETHDL